MGSRVGSWTRWHGRAESENLKKFPFNRFREPFGSQVNFTNGVMDGDWVIVDGEHNRCHLVSMKMGKRHGPTITWLPSGKIYSQWTFDQGVPVGEVLQANENGELQQSQTYLDGRRIVTKTDYHNTRGRQKKIEEMYLAATTVQATPDDFWNLRFATYKSEGEDLRHGPSKAWFPNGAKQVEGQYDHGKQVGRFTYWFPNGQIAQAGEFRDNQRDGVWAWWHGNGQKRVLGSYENDKAVGEWRWWGADGRLTKHEAMEGGKVQVNNDDGTPVETATAEPLLLPAPATESDPLDFLR
jgi:antitoxin component YwqK of YwqJK toxin-antitoxin module